MRALRTVALCLGLIAGTLILCAMFLLMGCATGPEPDPTPERPRIACIANGIGFNPRTGGKILPEIVRLIGRTSPEDGERWMVVRGVYDRQACVEDINGAQCGWLPFNSEAIRIGGVCGRQAEAIREIDRLSASNP